MKKVYFKSINAIVFAAMFFCIACCGFSVKSFGQASSYQFSSSTGLYTELSAGATQMTDILFDDQMGSTQTIPAGFDFQFNGVPITTFKACSNGFVVLNSTSTSSNATNSAANFLASAGMLDPLWDDLHGAGGTAGWEITGIAPNRILKIEFRNFLWNYQAAGPVMSFQVWLYETTYRIDFVYRQEANSYNAGSTGGATIGIASSSSSYLNLNATLSAISSSTFTTNIITKPPTNQVYTFLPPVPCNAQPTAGTVNQTLFNVCPGSTAVITVTGSTSGVSGLAYQWEQSPDGVNSWINASGGTGATTTSYTTPAYTTTIYYRMKISCTPTGQFAYSAVVQVTDPAVPTTQAGNVVANTATTNSITVGWTNGSSNRRIVYMNSVNSFVDPVTPNAPTGTLSTTWANAGQQLVYDNTGSSVAVSGLTQGTTYYFRVYEAQRCSATSYFYNTTTTANNPKALSTADLLKYTIARNTNITYTPVSASAISMFSSGIVHDDETSGAITFFPFNYCGTTVTQFRACTNGFMTLNSTNTSTAYPNALTGTTSNNMVLAPFWEDLYVQATGEFVKYEVTGTAPNRVLTVQWENLEVFFYPGPSLNFQVKLYESDSHIEYVYGVMQGFDGTNPNAITGPVPNGYAFSYTMGMTATTWSTLPLAGEVIGLQQANTLSFGSAGGITASEGINKLSVMPDCYSKYSFTLAGAVRPNDPAPGVPAPPINDEPANAIVLTPLPSVPADFCGSFYTSAFATPTAGVAAAIAGTNADDDVWFKFTANSTNTTITLRGSGGYDAAMQVFALGNLAAPLAEKNANNGGGTTLTETITSADLVTSIGSVYVIRVYHAGGGAQATASATVTAGAITGFTMIDPGSGYITCYGGAGVTATPFVFITDVTGTGAVGKVTVTGGAITAITIQGSQGGSGYSASPVVTIAPPSFGVTGDFSIIVNATPPPPVNDEICAAITLGCATAAANTTTATASIQAACAGTADDDVWYQWVASTPTDVVSVQSGAGFDAHLEILSSSNNTCSGTLTSEACINTTGLSGLETFTGATLTPGNTYFARVYHTGVGAGSGAFTISLNGNTNLWTGNTGNAWNVAANWSCGTVPTSTTNVSIPLTASQPVISSTASAKNITILTGATVTVNSGITFNIAGNLAGSGTLSATTATLGFNGSISQTISGFTVSNVVMANSAGIILGGNANVSGTLTLTSGIISLNGNTLTANTVSGGSATSYVKTDNGGLLKRNVGATNVVFPVGNTYYNPATLNNSGTADNYTINVTDDVLLGGTSGTTVNSPVVLHSWNISEEVFGGSNVTLTLQWSNQPGEEINSFTKTHVFIAHHNGTQWHVFGGVTSATALAAGGFPGAGPFTVIQAGITSFSPFAIGSSGTNPLAIELVNISAENRGGVNELNWSTGKEDPIITFEVQRGGDGKDFTTINSFVAKGDNSSYNYTDRNPIPGVNYYRLKMIDKSGHVLYSKIVTAIVKSSGISVLVYPNPVQDRLTVELYNISDGEAILTDLSGRILQKIDIAGTRGVIDMTQLPRGTYLVKYSNKQFSELFKISK